MVCASSMRGPRLHKLWHWALLRPPPPSPRPNTRLNLLASIILSRLTNLLSRWPHKSQHPPPRARRACRARPDSEALAVVRRSRSFPPRELHSAAARNRGAYANVVRTPGGRFEGCSSVCSPTTSQTPRLLFDFFGSLAEECKLRRRVGDLRCIAPKFCAQKFRAPERQSAARW